MRIIIGILVSVILFLSYMLWKYERQIDDICPQASLPERA